MFGTQREPHFQWNMGFKVNFLSFHYRAEKNTIFGMRGLWGLTINSGRGATLKYLQDGRKSPKNKMATILGRKVIISASILLRKVWLGSKLGALRIHLCGSQIDAEL